MPYWNSHSVATDPLAFTVPVSVALAARTSVAGSVVTLGGDPPVAPATAAPADGAVAKSAVRAIAASDAVAGPHTISEAQP